MGSDAAKAAIGVASSNTITIAEHINLFITKPPMVTVWDCTFRSSKIHCDEDERSRLARFNRVSDWLGEKARNTLVVMFILN